MTIWLDAQLPPKIALWIEYKFKIDCKPLRDIGLRDAKDIEIYASAKEQNAIIMTKDRDFMELYFRLGAPPKVIILNLGNLTTKYLQEHLFDSLPKALAVLQSEDIVEIG